MVGGPRQWAEERWISRYLGGTGRTCWMVEVRVGEGEGGVK